MKKGLFVTIVLIQFIACYSIIARHESILKEGTRFLFKTAPVDPYDAFRGRYVALSFDQETLKLEFKPEVEKFVARQNVYAVIETDPQGYAFVSDLLKDPPQNQDYLKVKFLWQWKNDKGTKEARVAFPFERYYMNEKLAPQAETLYRKHSRLQKREAYISVKIKKGSGVIENLYIAGKLIEDMIVRGE